MKPYLMDSGFLYALIDEGDRHSTEVRNVLLDVYDEIILPIPAITEVSHFVAKNLGSAALANFIGGLPDMNLILQVPDTEDYIRTSEILRKYNDANLDFVDVLIVAIAERLNVTKILTVDRRHFSMFKPGHCDAFEILP